MTLIVHSLHYMFIICSLYIWLFPYYIAIFQTLMMKKKINFKQKRNQEKSINHDSSEILKHKSNHKTKISIPKKEASYHQSSKKTNRNQNRNQLHLPDDLGNLHSIRQYCIVGQSFVPINSNDKRFISGLLSQTASTADQWKHTHPHRNRINRSIMTKSIHHTHAATNTHPNLKDVQTQCISDGNADDTQEKEESLDEVLLKLEFMYLPNDKCFQNLSMVEREHYSELLKCMISKISPLEKKLDQVNQEKIIQKIQLDIFMREYHQLELDQSLRKTITNLDYTCIGILHFIANFFCFIQLNYCEQFIMSLNKVYGLSYKERLCRISKSLSAEVMIRKPLSPDIFTDYIKQTLNIKQIMQDAPDSQSQGYKYIFYRAIFDTLNEEADYYRAFYQSQGQPFPWNTKMIKSFTFFTIDDQSIEVIFAQLREKVHEYSSYLCGIIYDSNEGSLKLSDKCHPLHKKRREGQDKLIRDWLEKIDQTPRIENQATKIYLQIDKLVVTTLVEEMCRQLSLF